VTRTILFASVAALATATPAFAQDAAPAPVSVGTFTGGHIGAQVGFADDDAFGTEIFTYGVDAGYDYDLGQTVVGATVEAQDSDDTGRDLSIVARAGVKATPTVLIYALGGYSNLKVVDGLKIDGFRAGGGVEAKIGPNFSVKLEQRYTDYEYDAHVWQTVLGAGFRF
jgi:outer membrane immunogenic protein